MECNRASEQNALSAHNVRVNTPGAAKLLASRQSKGETPEILGASLKIGESITFLAGSFYGTVLVDCVQSQPYSLVDGSSIKAMTAHAVPQSLAV